MLSVLIKNGQIVENGALVKKHVFIADGKIKDVSDEKVTADRVIDASGKVILPGIIDCHVHFREPGLTQKGDFLSESRAAAKGGITTILDMPNTKPETITVAALAEKRELAKKSVVNYGFHFGAADNVDEIAKAENIASVKIYLNETTGNMLITDQSAIEKIFRQAKIVSAHAEEDKFSLAIEMIKREEQAVPLSRER